MKKQKPSDWSDAKLMLLVFKGCIKCQLLPQVGSPCWKRLNKVIRKTR